MQITELPRQLFLCHGLKVLDISDNDLSAIPTALASLINVRKINLARNCKFRFFWLRCHSGILHTATISEKRHTYKERNCQTLCCFNSYTVLELTAIFRRCIAMIRSNVSEETLMWFRYKLQHTSDEADRLAFHLISKTKLLI